MSDVRFIGIQRFPHTLNLALSGAPYAQKNERRCVKDAAASD
nr:MAG TPA: hypothetical protein [Caudoviricetes sp.]